MLKLLAIIFVTIQVISGRIDKGADCGKKILKIERCIQKNLTPKTDKLEKALNICFRKEGCKSPRLEWDDKIDGNAVVDCLNEALTSKAHPLVQRCMQKKGFPSWRHAPVPDTPPHDSPQAKIQLAVEQAQDEDYCPKSKADRVGRCINVAVQKTLPKPKKEAETRKDYCSMKGRCEKAFSMSGECKGSIGIREVQQCECANDVLNSRYQKSADNVVEKCLIGYSDKQTASGIMKQIVSQRPKNGDKPKCKQTEDVCS